MSSSKVFKEDPAFKPIALVQEEIPLAEDINSNQDTEQLPAGDVESDPDTLQAGEQNSYPEVEQPLENLSASPTPQPEVDLQALQEESYRNGFEEASQQAQQQLHTVLDTFSTACQKLDDLHNTLLEKYRGDIINTAISLAEKIISSELETRRNIIADTLEKALEEAIKSEEFTITIHPSDLDTVEEIKEQLISHINGLQHIILKTSNEITPGGCLLESNTCSVDATLPAQLESAREFLEENTPSLKDDEAENEPAPL